MAPARAGGAAERAYLLTLHRINTRRPVFGPADMQSTRRRLDLRPLEVAQLGSPKTVAIADQDHGCVPMAPAAALSGGGHQPLDFAPG
jgi:hypothetical protein